MIFKRIDAVELGLPVLFYPHHLVRGLSGGVQMICHIDWVSLGKGWLFPSPPFCL